MAKSCFLRRKEVQFRWFRWLSEVLTSKSITQLKSITQQGIVEEDLLWSGSEGFSSSGKLKIQFVSGRQKAADYVKMLAQERRCLCREEWIFQQDKCCYPQCINNKEVFLWTKIMTSWPPSVLSRPHSYRKFVRIDCCKSLWRRLTVLSNLALQL